MRCSWSGHRRRGGLTACSTSIGIRGQTERIEASAVVVACGPLGSTKLLHNSTSSVFSRGLGNTEGVLGHFLHDHPREWWPSRCKAAEPPRARRLPDAPALRLFDALLATSWTLGTVQRARPHPQPVRPQRKPGRCADDWHDDSIRRLFRAAFIQQEGRFRSSRPGRAHPLQ